MSTWHYLSYRGLARHGFEGLVDRSYSSLRSLQSQLRRALRDGVSLFKVFRRLVTLASCGADLVLAASCAFARCMGALF